MRDKKIQEKRANQRYSCHIHSSCLPAFSGKKASVSAQIQDASLTGLCLVVDEWVEPGRMLIVTVPDPDGISSTRLLTWTMCARRHSSRGWLIGSAFCSKLEARQLAGIRNFNFSARLELQDLLQKV